MLNDCIIALRYPVSLMETVGGTAMDKIGGKRPVRIYLCEWREFRGLTQEQVAERIGTTKGTISKKENEWQKVDVMWLAAFADALNIEVQDLYSHPEKPTFSDLLRRTGRDISKEDQGKVLSIFDAFRKAS